MEKVKVGGDTRNLSPNFIGTVSASDRGHLQVMCLRDDLGKRALLSRSTVFCCASPPEVMHATYLSARGAGLVTSAGESDLISGVSPRSDLI